MELGWLEDFVTLCEVGNFSRAAEQRNLTQPAFSRHIKALEDWTGATLFDRTAQPIRPTPAGQALLPAAEGILRRLHQAREQARAAEAGAGATLHIAATHSLSLTFFPAWIRALEDAGRPFPIRLDSDTMLACEQALLAGQCQFLLCHADPAEPDRLDPAHFLSVQVGTDELVPCVAPALVDARAWLPGGAEAPTPYLAYSDASALGRAVTRRLAGLARPPHLARHFTSHLSVVLRPMVRDGKGLAWLPRSLVGDDLAAGRLAAVPGETWRIPLEVRVFRPRDRLAPAAEAFWELLAAPAARHSEPAPALPSS
ncbi:LysR family transcriptional regulator [Caenispirillum bisanense]|uniref:Transcriptional regulator, LysR family n=1 Tax=Caenispirillum bisanense TaxID=414052 RepID=A0A286H068_9PROT|nr:LysR substrate-binding domain-containing protein [Caenispirillum bisanense]SOE00846.1 transcriptional regulator, LysR family [Caenispirillum bisanense]